MEYFLVSFFLLQYVRTALDTRNVIPEWDRKVLLARYASVGLIAAYYMLDQPNYFDWIWNSFMLLLLYTAYNYDVFKSLRSIIQGIVPFVAIAILSDAVEVIAPQFFDLYGSYFSTAQTFGFILCFVIWFYARRQQNLLIKERAERRNEEIENRKQKESLEFLVAERTYELTLQKEQLQKTIEELKSTQNQLIQSEKMASLGELTAGIAHEIQNPLNFVNNFAEVSVEICQELEEEVLKTDLGQSEKDYIIEILGDLSQNQQKIVHHGRRADSIVKGMLQHSRSSSGEKEPTDVNALADEYMRLAYHGLRAKDKEFNASLVTEFDEHIGLVDLMPQDMGRVFLNLFTNAFYAVSEKKKGLEADGITNYKPEVKITTKKFDNRLFVRVEDNGIGMSESVIAKIFQPFFTTKPTGQGTGLGLSMSYDIITNAHGGILDVESVPGQKTIFKIEIPV